MDDLVVILKAKTEFLAISVRDLLEHNNIPAMVRAFRVMNDPETMRGIYESNVGLWGEVLIRRQDAAEANDLINGFLGEFGNALSDEELEAMALAAADPDEAP